MAASLGTAIGAIGGFAKWQEGRRMQKAGQAAIDNFEWQDLQNPYANLEISTMGSDLRAEELARTSASAIEAGRAGGARGIAAATGRVMDANVQAGREMAAALDEQVKARAYAAAGQSAHNQDLVERRQAEELQGYGQMLNVGMNMKYGGVADAMNAGFAQSFLTNPTLGMGGAMGSTSTPPYVASQYGGGAPTYGNYNDNAAVYANNYGGMYV